MGSHYHQGQHSRLKPGPVGAHVRGCLLGGRAPTQVQPEVKGHTDLPVYSGPLSTDGQCVLQLLRWRQELVDSVTRRTGVH